MGPFAKEVGSPVWKSQKVYIWHWSLTFPALLGDKAFGGYYLQGFDVYLHQKVNMENWIILGAKAISVWLYIFFYVVPSKFRFFNNPGTILASGRYGSFGSEWKDNTGKGAPQQFCQSVTRRLNFINLIKILSEHGDGGKFHTEPSEASAEGVCPLYWAHHHISYFLSQGFHSDNHDDTFAIQTGTSYSCKVNQNMKEILNFELFPEIPDPWSGVQYGTFGAEAKWRERQGRGDC